MKRVLIVSAVCLLLALGLMLWGFAMDRQPAVTEASGYCLLLVREDTGSDLMQLRKGLEAALGGRSLRLERLPAGPVRPDQAPYAAAEALFLYGDASDSLLEALKPLNKPIILLGESREGYAAVLHDEYAGGELLGQEILGSLPEGRVLAIGDSAQPAQARRYEGLLAELGERVLRLDSAQDLLNQDVSDTVCIAALSGAALEEMGALKRSGTLPAALPLYGVEAVESRVGLIEEGLLQGVVVDSPYAMGYIAGQLLARGAAELRYSPMKLVLPDTLYLAQNAQLMFPLLQ